MSARAVGLWRAARGAMRERAHRRGSGPTAGARPPAVPDAPVAPRDLAEGAGAATEGRPGARSRILSDADILEHAAWLIRLAGHHRAEYWPKALNEPYRPGMPLCVLGAVAVSLGARTHHDVRDLMRSEPVFDLLGTWYQVTQVNDQIRVPGWWRRRRAIRLLRQAAEVARDA